MSSARVAARLTDMTKAQSGSVDHERPLICHIIFRLGIGGLENGLVNLINGLPEERYRHAIVCLTEATEFKNRIHRNDVLIREIGKRAGKDWMSYQRVWATLRELGPSLVHARNIGTLDLVLPSAIAGVRHFVYSEHGLDLLELGGRHRKYNLLRRMSRPFVDRYVSLTHELATWLHREIGIPRERISVVSNGVDTQRFSPEVERTVVNGPPFDPSRHFVIGAVGRMEPIKRQMRLVEAFSMLLSRQPAWRDRLRLALIGDGRLRPRLERALEDAGVRDLAWIPGDRDDVPALYRLFDVFVLPSRSEGMSNTLLEAMASGCPVIATRVGGNVELIVEDQTGRLVPVDDAPALAQALQTYIETPQLLDTHGRAARRRAVHDYSLTRMIEAYADLYGGLLRGSKKS